MSTTSHGPRCQIEVIELRRRPNRRHTTRQSHGHAQDTKEVRNGLITALHGWWASQISKIGVSGRHCKNKRKVTGSQRRWLQFPDQSHMTLTVSMASLTKAASTVTRLASRSCARRVGSVNMTEHCFVDQSCSLKGIVACKLHTFLTYRASRTHSCPSDHRKQTKNLGGGGDGAESYVL